MRRPTMTNRASIYRGIAGSVFFTSPCKSYFELDLKYFIHEDLKANDYICDVMISNQDMSDFTTSYRHHQLAWSISVLFCSKCGQVCLQCWNYDRPKNHVTLGIATTGSKLTKTFGFLIADDTKSLKVLDVSEGELIMTFDDVDFSKPLWPAFSLFGKNKADISLSLRTGSSISFVPRHLLIA